MATQSNDIATNKIDISSLATLVIQLNIARRNCRAYPKGHPVIAATLSKALSVYEGLLGRHEEIILGITNDTLMLDGVVLEKSNAVFRDFSRVLFELGIGALIFHRGLTIEELNNFTMILGLKREQVHQHDGIESVWDRTGITAMSIRPIRYDLFQTTDEASVTAVPGITSSEGLWERFTRELMHGDPSQRTSDESGLDPVILAEILNQQVADGSISEAVIHSAVAALLTPVNGDDAPESSSSTAYNKLSALISNLTPELRRQFIDSAFGATGLDNKIVAKRILDGFSEKAILEILEDINNNRLSMSPVMFGLLQHLGRTTRAPQSTSDTNSADDDISQKMKTIFREHSSEVFVPDDYQKNLNRIIASDRSSPLTMEGTEDLLKTLESRSVENGIRQILTNVIRDGGGTPEERDLLLQNLGDMFGFYLQTGDYDQLHAMIDQTNDGTFPVQIQYRLRDEYGRREFLEEILDGLAIWGKPRYGDIRSLILKIGSLFVEVILDRLSEEKNMSQRRFYMDCLIEMGLVTQVPIVNRLYDNRWYFLRNLLIILAAQNDAAVIPAIRPLVRSDNPRLRSEALKTLVHFGDPLAEMQILEDLESQGTELQATAIQLAERCTSLPIATKLSTMIAQGGYSQAECERKSAIVRSLGEIGRAEVLPELAKILSSRSLLYSRHLTKLKTDIIRSLPKYPPEVARPVLERIAESSGDIARLAAETLKIIPGRHI